MVQTYFLVIELSVLAEFETMRLKKPATKVINQDVKYATNKRFSHQYHLGFFWDNCVADNILCAIRQ
jgi:hypothetical protein